MLQGFCGRADYRTAGQILESSRVCSMETVWPGRVPTKRLRCLLSG